MARSAVLAILAANFVAVGVLYSYFSNTEAGVQFNLKAQAFISTLLPSGHPNCGLLKWEDYTITSNRVVFEDGIRPAAGKRVRTRVRPSQAIAASLSSWTFPAAHLQAARAWWCALEGLRALGPRSDRLTVQHSPPLPACIAARSAHRSRQDIWHLRRCAAVGAPCAQLQGRGNHARRD